MRRYESMQSLNQNFAVKMLISRQQTAVWSGGQLSLKYGAEVRNCIGYGVYSM